MQIKEKSDLVLVYVTLYVVLCLKRLAKCANKERATQEMFTQALERFSLPGDADFPLNAFYERPKSAAEADELRKYLTQVEKLDRVFGKASRNSQFFFRSAVRLATAWWRGCSTPR